MGEVRRTGVVGLGTMGAGIVEVFARSGLPVVAVDAAPEWVERGRGILESSTARAVSRGRLSESDRSDLLGRVSWSTSVDDLADVDLVVEAVPEVLDLKRTLLASIDAVLGADAVIASNTSSLPITLLAEATGRPSRVVGMHFFNPAPVLRLVEVISTSYSAPDVVESVRSLAVRLGKTPIVVGDRPGFVANALLLGYLGDAVRLLESGEVSRENLDASLVEAGMPMGPLALLDLIGMDVIVHILGVLEPVSSRYAVPPGLAALVAEGHLGRKSGQGYWTYDRAGSGTVVDGSPGVASSAVADRLVLPYVNDALAMVGDGYATADDVDTAMREGCGFPRGPIEEADSRGLASVLSGLLDLGVEPASLLQDYVAEGRSTVR